VGVRSGEAGINVLAIPKRSPDLNVCDYALWAEVNRRMRVQEQKWKKNKKEGRDVYLKRLRRTALRSPKSFIEKAVGDMPRRLQRLYEAKGHHFEEGGKSK